MGRWVAGLPFVGVVFGIALGGEIATQPHGNRSCCDLGQPAGDNDGSGVGYARESGCERKRHCKPVRHSNYDVSDGFGTSEVLFDVWGLWHPVFPFRK